MLCVLVHVGRTYSAWSFCICLTIERQPLSSAERDWITMDMCRLGCSPPESDVSGGPCIRRQYFIWFGMEQEPSEKYCMSIEHKMSLLKF